MKNRRRGHRHETQAHPHCIPGSAAVALSPWPGTPRRPTTVEQVPRLTKEAVKEMLGKPDVVIVDIRYIKQYEQSDKKLPGAVFVQPENFDEFVKNHPQKDKTYVLY